jgi:hypothetical protein
MATISVPKDRPTRHRMVLVLREAEERYCRELLDSEERLLLHERIIRIKKRLAASSA